MTGLVLAGAAGMALSALLAWIQAPIHGGIRLGLGWMALPLALVAAAAMLARRRAAVWLCGAAGLAIVVFALLRVAVMDPIFWRLVDENEQYARMMSFSFTSIPGNFGIEPSFDATLATDTVTDRLLAALYFMGRGWWLCAASAVALIIAGARAVSFRRRRAVVAASVLMAVATAPLPAGLVGQFLSERGDLSLAAGHHAHGLRYHEWARRFDPQLAGSERARLRIGHALYQLGATDHADARFYLGDLYAKQGNRDAALAEYRLAAAAPDASEVVRRRIVWAFVEAGLADYERRLPAPAAGWWERALAMDADHFQAAYYLSRAYLDQGRYADSVATSTELLARSRRRLLNAQIQANLGDAYWKLDDPLRARTAYETSMALDRHANYRILRSLGGT